MSDISNLLKMSSDLAVEEPKRRCGMFVNDGRINVRVVVVHVVFSAVDDFVLSRVRDSEKNR